MIRIRNISRQADLVQVKRGSADLPEQNRVRIYTGDVAVSTTPVVIETLLGSCVSVCLYDPSLRVGGMNHILLAGERLDFDSTRFGLSAMEVLINELRKVGGDRERFVAKAFGGGNVFPGIKSAGVGEMNVRFIRQFFADCDIPLVAQRLGGTQPVCVEFRTDTGKARLHSIDGSQLHKLLHSEQAYWKAHFAEELSGGKIP